MFFDAQFSYETLALPVLVWALVLALRAARRDPARPGGDARAPLVVAALLLAALVVIHHVSAVVACAALVGVAVVASVRSRRSGDSSYSPATLWSLAGWAVVLTTWRFVVIGHPLVVYLGPTLHVSSQLSELLSLLGIGAGLPAHAAFASASIPWFEVACAYAMLPVLLVVFVGAVWGMWAHRRTLPPLAGVTAVLGALFFVSLPLASAAAYAEAVHRSWAFSFLGLATTVGLASRLAFDGDLRVAVRRRRLWPSSPGLAARPRLLASACAAVVAVGGIAVGTSASYRFGAPVAPETDPLYVGTQTGLVATWLSTHAAPGDVVYASRFTIRPIAVASTVGVADPGGPELLLLLAPSVPRAALEAFVHDHVAYVVFDRRTGLVGGVRPWFWYVPSDAQLPIDARTTIYPGRLACLDWASTVYATSDLEVLQVDTARLASDLDAGRDGFVPGCATGGSS
jgi:hypothetical protein